MRKIFCILLLLSLNSWASNESLGPFETDFCTSFPDGTTKEPELWKHCCLKHDMFFWAGGSREDRDQADLELRSCVESTGQMDLAKLMYWTVRVTSYSPIKYSKKKWNHGWPSRPDSQALTSDDIDEIEREILGSYDFIPLETKQQFIGQLRGRLN